LSLHVTPFDVMSRGTGFPMDMGIGECVDGIRVVVHPATATHTKRIVNPIIFFIAFSLPNGEHQALGEGAAFTESLACSCSQNSKCLFT
jgi:hypothetical protein